MWGRAGRAQSPWSEHCSWYTVTPMSTCYSSAGAGASRPPQTPQQSQALNLSTYRLLWESPHCSRKGSASVGHREGENGSSDPLPRKRALPDRIACRAAPGGGRCLLEDRKYSGRVIFTALGPEHPKGQPALVSQCLPHPVLPGCSQNHFNQLPLLEMTAVKKWSHYGPYSQTRGHTISPDTE